MLPTKEKALKAYDYFIDTFNAKYPKTVKILTKDKNAPFKFHDFPAEQQILLNQHLLQ